MARGDFLIRGRVQLEFEPPAIPVALEKAISVRVSWKDVPMEDLASLRRALHRERQNLEHLEAECRRINQVLSSTQGQRNNVASSVKELQEKVDRLEEVATLRKENAELRAHVAALEKMHDAPN